MKVIRVSPLTDYKLQVVFDDDVSGIVDLKQFVKNGIFSVLQDELLFNKVYTNGYSIAWSNELEIDALTVYAEFLNKKPEEIMGRNFSYATN
jgi:hypothetical protein